MRNAQFFSQERENCSFVVQPARAYDGMVSTKPKIANAAQI